MKEHLIDIIIPAYNAHNTLRQTLNSIAMQTMVENIRVIIVDDHSDENYNDIQQIFSSMLNIKLIREYCNCGPGTCRKIGLEYAEAKYVCFADADDVYLTPNAIESMYNSIVENKVHMVTASFLEELLPNKIVRHEKDMIWVFAKMYELEFLNKMNITFNDTRANEDAGFNLLVKLCTDKIAIVNSDVYLWRYHENAITKKDNKAYSNHDSIFGLIENRTWAILEAEKRSSTEEKLIETVFDSMIIFYCSYLLMKYKNPDNREIYFNRIKDYYNQIYINYEEKLDEKYIQARWDTLQKNFRTVKQALCYLPDITYYDFLKRVRG